MRVTVKCDASCTPNPGVGSIAFAVHDGSRVCYLMAKGLEGEVSSNLAEYTAVYEALLWLHANKIFGALICSDSQLVVRQVSGEFACNVPLLDNLRVKVTEGLKLVKAELMWISRDENGLADALAKRCQPINRVSKGKI